MRKINLLLTLFLFVSAAFSQNWILKWEDNFDASVLNENTHWQVEVNGDGGGNNEMQYYRRENITIEKANSGENCLVINAKRENFSDKLVTSGRLTTQNKVSVKYGKMEARIKLPKTANGLWPAFWMMGKDISTVGWPRCGETDILEMGSGTGISQGKQETYFNGACHYGESHEYNAQVATADYSLQDDFHLYTLIWDANTIKMYLDMDKFPAKDPYFVMDISQSTTIGQPGYYFHKPFFVLFNLAVGGGFTGITGNSNINQLTALNPNGTPAKMYIDYVRIYQQGDVGEQFLGPAMAADHEKPTVFTANMGEVTTTSVELLLKASDNSGSVFYTINYGNTSYTVNGKSGIQTSHIISGLEQASTYNFSIVAHDGAGNTADVSPLQISGTTLSFNTAPVPSLAASNVIAIFSDPYPNIAQKFDLWYASQISEIVAGTDKIKSVSNLASGAAFGTPNFSTLQNLNEAAMEKLHVDIFPKSQSAMQLGIVTTTGECKLPLILETGVWNSINLSLADLKANNPACDFSQVKQVGFWMVDGNFYMDNLLFYKGDYLSSTAMASIPFVNRFSFFPNPVSDKLVVSSNSNIAELIIRNLSGLIVKIFFINNNRYVADIREMNAGNYLLTCEMTDGKTTTHKIVKL